jgi:transposase
LISVLDRESGFPIYYRYVPGNIVDVTTLKTTLYELQEYGVNINRLVLDADYYSEENLTELYNSNIPFMTRIASRYSIYDLLVKKYVPDIVKPANFVEYGNRKLFIIKDKINLFRGEIPAFVYICLDEETKHKEYLDYLGKTRLDNISDEKFRFDLLKQGIFIIVSTIDLKNSEVLPCYYSRQSVEQFFDYLQNDIDLLPLRTHSEKTFSGHIMISFISTIIYYSIDKKLKAKGISLSTYLHSIKLLIGRIYKNTIIPAVPTKRINDVLKALKITLPTRIFLDEL